MDQTSSSSHAPAWPAQKARNGHNEWIKNEKIKTAKCDTCDERVKVSSWTCSKCKKHICSECAEESGQSRLIHKYTAKYQLSAKCFCAWPSNTAPGFSRKLRDLGFLPAIGSAVTAQAPVTLSSQPSSSRGSAVGPSKRPLGSLDAVTRPKKQRVDFDKTQGLAPTISSVKLSRRSTKSVKYNEDSDDDERVMSYAGPSRVPKHQRKSSNQPTFFVEEDETASSSGADMADESEEEAAPSPCARMDAGSTVIIGGGIVGLCVAFELARKCRATKTKHIITIVEIQSDCCSDSTASGNCAGILSALYMHKNFELLAAQAEQAWQDLEEIFKLNGGVASVDFKRDNVLGRVYA